MLSHYLVEVINFLQEYHTSYVFPFQAYHLQTLHHIQDIICLIKDDINLDPLTKVLSASFVSCNVTGYPFGINNYLVERYSDYTSILFLYKLSPTNFLSIANVTIMFP